ncbi:ABC transporter permease [Actinoplanes hulinensis]|uniref:ABC transporter permease n=1 Tax=Actinoplanes hulinensis TaxID=1144547 RepID=A0ABS7B6E0_9ACTN|nr:ABC transporter permease [Actinoplanes hulinensis]MBW6436029.1 ABC transporter permease [Actinoplanes hulinensis]
MEPLIDDPALTGTPLSSEPATPSKTSPNTAKGKSPTRIALSRLRRDKVAMVSLGVFLLFVFIAIFAPLLAKLEGQDPTTLNIDLIDRNGYPLIGITGDHWFGIEPRLGRDLFARWVYGARPSLIVAGLVTVITTIIGVAVGLIAGFAGGWVDRVLSWIIDFVLSLPYLLFAIAVPAVLLSIFVGTAENADAQQVAQVRFFSLILVLSIFGWASLARLIRGEVLSLREREFIQAARVLGVPTHKVLFKELLPNLVGPIIVSSSIALPTYIVTEAGLTFLGVGLVEPTPSWGLTISTAVTFYRAHPIFLWVPVIGITILVLALSLLGDAIRDAFDPRTRR